MGLSCNWAIWVRIPRQDYRKVKNKKKRGRKMISYKLESVKKFRKRL